MTLPIKKWHSKVYRGRFAPSPSGPLHFGSLVAALGGYLQAKTQKGLWLLRIDDIDPPRQDPDAITTILSQLEAHGLHWDDAIFYQSQQTAYYDAVLHWLETNGFSYSCRCTRKQIQSEGGIYQGHCKNLALSGAGHSVRLTNQFFANGFSDNLLGDVTIPENVASEDFIIRRKDGLYAYHLAAVVDDIQQGITEVVRGADLLFPSACQLALYHAFSINAPELLHLPVAVSSPGRKLSKQGHAKPLINNNASFNLYLALRFLGLPAPNSLQHEKPNDILLWGERHWQLASLYAKPERELPLFLHEEHCEDSLF